MKLQQHLFRGILCAGLAAGLSFAQSSPTETTPAQSGQETSTSGDRSRQSDQASTDRKASKIGIAKTGHAAGAAGNSDASMVGKMDHEFMTKAAMGGMMEVQAAQMAQQKASSQEVRDYARKLEHDHSLANDKLKAIAKERQVSLPTDVGAEHKAMIGRLNALSGAEFDKAYMKAMVADHRKDIREFEKASNRSMDSDLKNFASSTLPTLKEHLQQAGQLNGSTRSRKQ
ncbi:MAG: DUF4142 domain-containing protein [Bryobacteraceae bacterium]|nr:DUF4142 domain-containing protein [Bryobacteraceae bacterium]